MDHWISRTIISKFIEKPTASWSDISIDGVGDNLIGYYLKKLKTGGFITKIEGVWQPTQKGALLVSDTSMDTHKITRSPKICISFLLFNKNGEVGLFVWKRQPYKNKLTVPYGRWHFGKTLDKMIALELEEKCGIQLKNKELPSFVGTFSIDEDGIHEVHTVYTFKYLTSANHSCTKGDFIWINTSKLDGLEFATTGHKRLVTDLLIQVKTSQK